MVFFKYYDPNFKYLTYCGLGHFEKNMPVSSLVPILCEKAGLPKMTPLALYEEEFMATVNKINDHSKSLGEAISDFRDGDIIVFHRTDILIDSSSSLSAYYHDLLHKVEVIFCDKNNPNDVGFILELSLKMTYDEIAETVAMRLGTDPYLLQFFRNQRYFVFIFFLVAFLITFNYLAVIVKVLVVRCAAVLRVHSKMFYFISNQDSLKRFTINT